QARANCRTPVPRTNIFAYEFVPICFLKWHTHRRNLPVVFFVLHQVILKTETSQLVFKNIKFRGIKRKFSPDPHREAPVNSG
ncbi:MAG: hypothetical protein ABIW76_04905, partial [Fibrobacteria bacterium]